MFSYVNAHHIPPYMTLYSLPKCFKLIALIKTHLEYTILSLPLPASEITNPSGSLLNSEKFFLLRTHFNHLKCSPLHHDPDFSLVFIIKNKNDNVKMQAEVCTFRAQRGLQTTLSAHLAQTKVGEKLVEVPCIDRPPYVKRL